MPVRSEREAGMNKGFAHLTVCAVLLSLSGCISTFNPVSGDIKFKPKTMAVVAGLDNEQNVQMAQTMSESLRKYTRFQVMTHKQAAQKLPGYPAQYPGALEERLFRDRDRLHEDRHEEGQVHPAAARR